MQVENKCDIIKDIKNIRDVENLLCELGCSKKEAGYVIKIVKSAQGEPDVEGEGEPNPDIGDETLAEAFKATLETLKSYKV